MALLVTCAEQQSAPIHNLEIIRCHGVESRSFSIFVQLGGEVCCEVGGDGSLLHVDDRQGVKIYVLCSGVDVVASFNVYNRSKNF